PFTAGRRPGRRGTRPAATTGSRPPMPTGADSRFGYVAVDARRAVTGRWDRSITWFCGRVVHSGGFGPQDEAFVLVRSAAESIDRWSTASSRRRIPWRRADGISCCAEGESTTGPVVRKGRYP